MHFTPMRLGASRHVQSSLYNVGNASNNKTVVNSSIKYKINKVNTINIKTGTIVNTKFNILWFIYLFDI